MLGPGIGDILLPPARDRATWRCVTEDGGIWVAASVSGFPVRAMEAAPNAGGVLLAGWPATKWPWRN